ncbi:MAG: DUF6069 family protein [Corynebacterium sp.]|uniref:DUF6069 family protein n=1 Tax=unclassified Corynebacterium TaxID=2624378 RepID=UPI00264955D5|nr:DUF6069 family protein [Corynebacterium sp.]MDN5720081.1 DUF6069 family protein [Corynebacterium sp.]
MTSTRTTPEAAPTQAPAQTWAQPPKRNLRAAAPFKLGRHAIITVGATVANALVFAGGSAAGASMTIDSSAYSQITMPMTITATLIPLLGAGAATWLIARRTPRFRTVALWLGLSVALLSTASPFVVAQDTATTLSLAAMHLVAAIAWSTGLTNKLH